MKINPNEATGQMAVEAKEAIPVFEKYGIDYSCEGGRTLKDSCYFLGVPLEKVVADLEKAKPNKGESYLERDWRQESMEELINYLLENHHPFVRAQTKRIIDMINAIASRPEGPPLELAFLRPLFESMANEMESHMLEEEETVFPFLIDAEQAFLHRRPPHKNFENYDDLHHPLRVLAWEHGETERKWKELDRLTNYFRASADQKEILQPLYDALLELEKDNHKHFHLENNILLKKAAQLGLLKQKKSTYE